MLTKEQRTIFTLVKDFLNSNLPHPSPNARLEIVATTVSTQRDRRFLSDLADELRLEATYDEFDPDGNNLIVLSFDQAMIDFNKEEAGASGSDEGDADEGREAIQRVLKKYEKAQTAKEFDEAEWEEEQAVIIKEKMATWKNNYYRVRRGHVTEPRG